MALFELLTDEEKKVLSITFGNNYELLNESGFAMFWQNYVKLDAKGRRHIWTVTEVLAGEQNNRQAEEER